MLSKANIKDIYTLSPLQKGMLFQHVKEESTAYFEQLHFTIKGQLYVDSFEASFQHLINKYDVLRTVFLYKNMTQPMQMVLKERKTSVHFEDISHLDSKAVSQYVEEFKNQDREKGFELSKDILMRFAILKAGAKSYHLIWSFHHILMDGWCMGIVLQDLFRMYQQHRQKMPITVESVPAYSEYIRWLEKQNVTKARDYWKNYLEGYEELTGIIRLDTKHTSHNNEVQECAFTLDKDITEGLTQLARHYSVTVNTLFQTIWGMLLQKYNNKDDVVFGAVVSGRPSEIHGVENMVGLFINTVPIRIQKQTNDTFSHLLKRVHESTLLSKQFEFVSLADIQTDAGFSGQLLDHILVFENYPISEGSFEEEEFTMDSIKTYEKTSYDLNVMIRPNEDQLDIAFQFNDDVYSSENVKRLFQHMKQLALAVIKNPDERIEEIAMITEEERHQILHDFQGEIVDFVTEKTLPELFEEQVKRTPEAIALRFEDQQLTYQELNQRVNQLAWTLRMKGLQREELVGIMVQRSLEMIVGVLAVIKAGGAYVPIDPEYPLDRIQYMLEDSGTNWLLTTKQSEIPSIYQGHVLYLEEDTVYHERSSDLEIVNQSSDLAYIVYTSGSTGQPKGVMIDHRAVHNLHLSAGIYGIAQGSQVLQFASLSFDASVGDIFHSLLTGATLHLVKKEQLLSGHAFMEWLNEASITTIPFIPPSVLKELPYAKLPKLKTISTGGEELPADLVRIWGANRTFLNAYGPTETTVDASIGDCIEMTDKPSIGTPTVNKRAYILDQYGHIQPIGVPGELCVGGEGVARGYLHRPELTDEKFVNDPYVPNGRMYKTGDLARWLPDGTIEFLGRMDGQVKIRGFRIELGEIEARLNQAPSVKQAVVLARSGEQKQVYLCAYLVTDKDLQVSALRKELSQTLPDYMIPSFFIKVDKIPVTVNGKIDKKALPEPEKEVELQTEYVAPTNPTEEILVQIWQKVLGMERVGIGDNFFELGGHSIKAMMLASNIYKELKIDLPLREIFKHTTVKEMARFIDGRDEEEYVGIQPAAKQEYYPVSSAQKRMYVIQSLEDKDQGTSYNMPSFYKMKGSVDAEKLEKVFQTLIDRHESLRTSFHMIDEQLVQKVHEQVSWKMDMKTVSANDVSRLKDSFVQPFDISTAPLFRASLLTIHKDEHILMMDVHHIVGDGVSTTILFQELIQLYQGQALPEVKIHYKDYAVWQLSQQDRLKESENFWLQQFSGELPVLELPTDYSRPPIRRLEGEYVSQSLRGDLHESVKAFMKNHEVTLYMVLLATYNVLLHKYTNQRDIIVGTPVSDRPHPDVMSTVGMFVNTLAVRNQLESEQTFEEFLANVKNKMLEVYGHQEYPFEDLIEKVKVQRDTSRHPLFDTMFGVQNLETSHAELPDWGIEPLDIDWTNSKFDMSWMVFEADGLEIGVEYSTNLFERNTIQRMIGHFEHIIEQIMENPQIRLADIQLATEDEKVQILEEFNHQPTKITYDQAIQNRFEEQVMKTPDAVALVFKGRELTYRELNQRSNQMARTLREHGVGRDQIIAVMINRSHELIISILAVLKAGGAYLPIDPTYPLDRIEHMLEDSQTAMVLTQKEIQIPTGYSGEVLCVDQADIYHEDTTNLSSMNQPTDLAYIIYTSGSTGKSKGVMIEHRSLHNLIHISHPYKMGAGSRVLQFASSSFDASVAEIFPALLTGSTLYIEEKEELLTNLVPYLLENQITTVALPPSLLRSVPYTELPALECIVSVGEACTFDIVQTWGQNRTFINGYGPTESTVCSAFGVVTAEDKRITIGKPFPNQKAYIINENQQLQPIGVPGELCIAGAGLSRGYLNRPELTQEKFVNNPFAPGERMYKTGDVARWLPDGNIEYVGRMDDQVKVRGNRVELGEVTSQLLTHPSITEAVVVPIVDTHGATTLCAYFIEDKEVKVNDLRHHLAKALPEFMIPAYFIKVDDIPLTGNGKVNKRALPDPSEFISAQAGHEIVAPSSQDEEILVQVWEEVLQIKPIGVEDNFFERGGDSIKALQIAARLSKYNRKLDSRHIFKNPTISMLAPYLEQRGALIEQDSIEGEVPLTPIQSWFFEQPFVHPHHFNQSMLLPNEQGWDRQRIEQAFTTIVRHHDALRMNYQFKEKIIQENQGIEGEFFTLHEVDVTKEKEWQMRIEQEANQLQASFDLTTGPLVKLGLYHTEYGDYLLIVVHHLLIDGVSWRILLEDFQTLYEQKGELPAKTTSFKTWAVQLEEYARSKKLQDEASYWKGLLNKSVRELPADKESSDTFLFGDTKEVQLTFDINETQDLLANAHHAYKTKADDLLLAALVLTINEWTKESDIIVNLEGHGRETIVEGIDLSRTIGWFTTIYPVLFEVENHQLSSVIKHVKETLRNVPNNGIGFGILQYMSHSDVSQSQLSSHHISFNYLGQMGEDSASQSETDNGVLINTGDQISPMNANPSSLNMTCLVMNNTLLVTFDYNPQRYEQGTIQRLADRYKSNLQAVLDHCVQREQTERTPSDFSTKKLSLEDLDDVFATLKNL
ncbi:plipastatin synthase subunit C [Brevibacillus halotolerans]|uniref:non-ribosomal peptide synthetase n=1 Tax=Brevibacillus halotolerans TaxID=1507437 RepID=UPI001B256F74|nr:non-ribosomal peptide synthetase [Brevibacillus halotolerans]GIO01172.1 plipastatin synthase subunit C [Brevibacillus halotolerans]